MPIILLFIGILLLVSAYNNTYACLFTQVKQDVTIQFGAWVVAVVLIGAIGYVKKLEPVSNAMLALIIVVLFLSRQGVWSQLTQAVGTIGSGASLSSVGSAATVAPLASGAVASPSAASSTSGNAFSSPFLNYFTGGSNSPFVASPHTNSTTPVPDSGLTYGEDLLVGSGID